MSLNKLPYVGSRSPHHGSHAGKKMITKTLSIERLIGGTDWALISMFCPRSSSSRKRGDIALHNDEKVEVDRMSFSNAACVK